MIIDSMYKNNFNIFNYKEEILKYFSRAILVLVAIHMSFSIYSCFYSEVKGLTDEPITEKISYILVIDTTILFTGGLAMDRQLNTMSEKYKINIEELCAENKKNRKYYKKKFKKMNKKMDSLGNLIINIEDNVISTIQAQEVRPRE